MIWFILLILGILTYFSYFIVERSVAHITKTPVWVMWLVMMLPAFVWATWILIYGAARIPLLLLSSSFILSSILYWFLVQWGRVPRPKSTEPQPRKQDVVTNTVTERQPASLRPINKEEEVNLQNCFPWSVYYLQNIEHRPQALICRGQLRSSPEVAYRTVRENIESYFNDRFLVVFQEGLNGKPFFVLVPNPTARSISTETDQYFRPGLALGLLVATLLTTTLAGVMLLNGGKPEFPQDLPTLLSGLPYALALMAVLGVHELGHYLAARFYRVRATLPYFIPVPPAAIFPFGTFGAFIQLRSPLPNRKALFDVGIAGPLSGFLVTVPVLWWGLAHSEVVSLTDESGILNFDSFNPASSFLITVLSKLALGGTLAANQAIDLHPVAIAGCLGLIITALNLMPVGQLDGGHIVHAMFGQRTGAVIGQITRLLVLALSLLVQRELFLWALLLFFMPVVDEPALNDVTELDNLRDFLGLLSLGLLVAIVLPAPQVITQILF